MSTELVDPRVQKLQKYAGGAGVAVVGVGAVVVTAVAGSSIIFVAVVTAIALFCVNFVVPVSARAIALLRQKSLTALAENFSEETIRDDEVKEGNRISDLERSYKDLRAQLEGSQEELRNLLTGATADQAESVNSQIAQLQTLIDNAETALRQRKTDFAELQKANKFYITFERSARLMEKAQGSERTEQERQSLLTAREAIKNRMRAATAGQTIQAMNAQIGGSKPSVAIPNLPPNGRSTR